MLILIFSGMLYHYIKITIFESSVQSMIKAAETIAKTDNLTTQNLSVYYANFMRDSYIKIENGESLSKPKFRQSEENAKTFLTLHYPYRSNEFISIKKDTTVYNEIVKQILIDIIIVNATMIFLIIFYAMFLSRMLLMPIKTISYRLSKLNENFLRPIGERQIPDEFKPLSNSINRLIERIQTFMLYQKELFIGVAHELKTPLAVMKTKNEVTLIKERESDRYIEALRLNNAEIDSMNKMISSILQIGRQEGAQFEEPENIDIINYINELCLNFKILARTDNKDISINLSPKELFVLIQPNLFLHVIQNFVQNAIKFAEPNSVIEIRSKIIEQNLVVEVLNQGEEIDEKIDYFAPFKRFGNKSGAGLGLFLAKNAASAMGAKISLQNRTDEKKGVISTFILPI
ncbi:MAG: HAMP domain-containing histidine kinase [Campylobacter sp.]|nr:HAMP domain-containing histidine kinase [Campylobacter sp.]